MAAPPVNPLPVAYEAWTSLAVPDWLNKGDNAWQMVSATLVGMGSRACQASSSSTVASSRRNGPSTPPSWPSTLSLRSSFVGPRGPTRCPSAPFWGKAGPALGQKFLTKRAALPATSHYYDDGRLETPEIEPFYPMATMVWFQCVFAAISLVILAGSVLARMNFKAWMMFVPLWLTFFLLHHWGV